MLGGLTGALVGTSLFAASALVSDITR
jgi:hypothetical protein